MTSRGSVCTVYAKLLRMCQWWVLLGSELLSSDVSGVDTAILIYPTAPPCMISLLLTFNKLYFHIN